MLSPEDFNVINDSQQVSDPLGLDVDAVHRRKKQLKEEIVNDKDRMYKKNIQETQEVGFKAIEREFSIENMIKKEEKAKEDSESLDLEEKIRKEEKKADCIHKQLEEKELDDDWEDKQEAKEEMDRLKKKINLKVETGRNRIRQLLGKMRKKAKIRKTELMQRLQDVRAKMAKEIILANKEGSYKPCINGKTNIDFRENYCNTNFVDDFVHNTSCKEAENYCYTCCQHEFGQAYKQQRSNCYKMCDNSDKQVVKDVNGKPIENSKKDGTTWLWAPTIQVDPSNGAAK
jgi:hypothetical protein